jgi:hypothetical protein
MIASDVHVTNTNEVLVHATAGIHMYRRRGGLKYAIAEFHMQSILIKYGLQNRFFAYILGFLRMIIFLSPNWFRAFFYLYLLRNRKLKF